MRPVATLFRSLLCVMLTVAMATACGSKSGEDDDDEATEETDEQAPAVPPPGSLTIETDVGEDVSDAQSLVELNMLAPGAHDMTAATTATLGVAHAAAALGSAIVTGSVVATMVVPIALLKAAQSDSPEYKGKNDAGEHTWLWSYDVVSAGVTYTANLTGTKTGGGSTWSLAVTSDKANAKGVQYEDFVFLTGTVTDVTTGTWQVMDPTVPEKALKLYEVEYDYTDDDNKTLTYTVNGDRDESETFGKGSYVSYVVTPASVTIDIKDSAKGADKPLIVTWNRVTGEGSITNIEGEKSCWGDKDQSPKFPDVACAE